MLNRAICSTQAKQAVAAALMDNVKVSFDPLTCLRHVMSAGFATAACCSSVDSLHQLYAPVYMHKQLPTASSNSGMCTTCLDTKCLMSDSVSDAIYEIASVEIAFIQL